MAGGKRALVEEFLDYALGAVHLEVRSWFPEAEIEEVLRGEVRGDVEWLYSDEWAEQFMQNCPVDGASADDYKSRVVELPCGLRVIAGIRFQGLDLDKPFVDVMHPSSDVAVADRLDRLFSELREQFAVFGVERLRIYRPASLELSDGPLVVTEDLRYLAAPLARMRRLPRPEHYERVVLKQASSLDFFAEYGAVYAQLIEERPWIKDVARPEDRGDLESYLAGGTLFEVFVDDEWAGIVAAFRAAEKGVSGYCVAEIILKREFRGKRLGLAVQRKFVEKLDETRGRVLWGTIGAANTPAIRTAKRCGRVDVGGYYWVRRG